MSEKDLTPEQRTRWEQIKKGLPANEVPIPPCPEGKKYRDLSGEEFKELIGIEPLEEDEEEDDDF